jgi:lipopolysaccharide/colanic/teichoic acid biosynthesis glycosyltransferase
MIDAGTPHDGEAKKSPRHGTKRIVWRLSDIVLGSTLLLLCLPTLGAACLAVCLESAGPPFRRQERRTRDGRSVRLIMLRTTRHTHFGPKPTRTGEFLRRSHMDHLPVLINVITGDLSLTGPQPEFRGGARGDNPLFAFRGP